MSIQPKLSSGKNILSAFTSGLLPETGKYWHPIKVSFDEGIGELGSIRTVEIAFSNTTYLKVPTPIGFCNKLLDAPDVELPLLITMKGCS